LKYRIGFRSEEFKYTGEVRESANAGNRFYGEDIAQYLQECLEREGYESGFLDEDWGWLVSAWNEKEIFFNISVGNIQADLESGGKPTGTNEWAAYVEARRKTKRLGFIPWNQSVSPDINFCRLVEKCLLARNVEIIETGEEN
jgi:hypothetical protein